MKEHKSIKDSKVYKIDPRDSDDIKAQIKELAASYTPEWVFDPDDPDIGSVIALIFGEQLSESIDRLNQLPEKYRAEFVNMLNIGLLSAYPAQGVVVMELIRDTVSGVNVPLGTKLLGNKEDGGVTVFETLFDLHVTNSRLSDAIMISPELGKIIPLMGKAEKVEILPPPNSDEEDFAGAENADESDGENTFENITLPSFKLFDFNSSGIGFDSEGIQQNALLIYHQSVFDTGEETAVSIRAISDNGTDLSGVLADGKRFKWSYYDGEKLTPFESVSANGDEESVVLLRGEDNIGKLALSGEADDLAMVCVEAVGAVSESIDIKSLQISSSCDNVLPSFVISNESEKELESFLPFGEQASIFDECYIGHDRIFKQQGAEITLRFDISYHEKLVTFTSQQENEQLKVIKRKPVRVAFDTARTCVENVAFEYFNGTGWKRLAFNEDWAALFDGNIYGSVEMSFICPEDWQSVSIGGNTERVIRMRVTRADNCYLQPCVHNMPLMKGLNISYSYEGGRKLPHRLRSVTGTRIRDITSLALSGRTFTAFEPLPYTQNALYLGFDRKIDGAPISLFFEVEESVRFSGAKFIFEYSSPKGFSQLRVRDDTNGLSNSGTVMFMPGGDFSTETIEGVKRYWLRITEESNTFASSPQYRPVIRRILPNAVPIHNVRTLEEEVFFIETVAADMSFPLPAINILSAEVYVNERELSRAAMSELTESRPDDVRAEYDAMGRPTDFFVKWSEAENFDNSSPGDRHYVLDRMSGSIRFGDGVNVKIPTVTGSAAFTVRVRCCDGAAANLPAGAVNSVLGNILYIENVYNPVATYAGNDIETYSQAIERGASIINSKNRLVSETDFVREAKAFSGMISQVKCVVGQNPDGSKKSGAVSLAVLMRDYSDGSYSFDGICERLKTRLLQKSEATLTESDLHVTEPLFVTITVDIWLKPGDYSAGFEAQNMIIEHIRGFIEPISPESKDNAHNRRIGELPTVQQLKVALNSLRSGAVVRRFSVTARYTDSEGTHERELAALKVHPFMLGVNGEHKIHMM